MMSLRPVYGHARLRQRLASAVRNEKLPASLLLTGPRGVGKQRLALWLGQRLLCDSPASHDTLEPCGTCQQCRYALKLQHPDLHWFFPRERLKITDPSADDVRADLGDAIADRLKADGLWSASLGMEGLHSATVKALLHAASRRPAMAARSVFVIGDAERMVSQEGSDQAANAFLKLLEEPPTDATLILTSSEPGALLPTIRSRVVTVRVAPLPADDVADFIRDPAVQARLGAGAADLPSLLALAGGAPGRLLEDAASADAHEAAQRLLDAALAPRTPEGDALRAQVAASAGVTKARGVYSDVLDALTVLLHARVRGALDRGLDRHARRVAIAVATLERAKLHTQHNVTPQLITAVLLDDLAELVARPA